MRTSEEKVKYVSIFKFSGQTGWEGGIPPFFPDGQLSVRYRYMTNHSSTCQMRFGVSLGMNTEVFTRILLSSGYLVDLAGAPLFIAI
jgi:hypothetical protein